MLFNFGDGCRVPIGTAVYLVNDITKDVECGVCIGAKYMLGQGYSYYITDAGPVYFNHSFKDEDIGEKIFLSYNEAKEAKENGDTLSD